MSPNVGGVPIISREPDRTCGECGAVAECRPYGVDDADICFGCASQTPQHTFRTNVAIGRKLFGLTQDAAEQAARIVANGDDHSP